MNKKEVYRLSVAKNKYGFTLMETLLAVIIIAILCAFSFIGIAGMTDKIKQTKLDNIAQSMYVSAQNRITELAATGELSKLIAARGTGAQEIRPIPDTYNAPSDWGDEVDKQLAKELCYIYSDKNGSETDSELIDLLLPKGSISDALLDDNWIIELDVETGYIYSVFYSEDRSSVAFYTKDYALADGTLRNFDGRSSQKGIDKVGYYSGNTQIEMFSELKEMNARVNIVNADELRAELIVNVPVDLVGKQLSFDIKVKGLKSGNTVSLPQVFIPAGSVQVKHKLVLDNLTEGNSFREQFCTTRSGILGLTASALRAGEDIEISFTVKSDEPNVPNASAKGVTNSLFASLSTGSLGESGGEAVISCGRHLQNLNLATSGIANGEVVSAVQASDIDFSDNSDGEAAYMKWATIYKESGNRIRAFKPVTNDGLKSYLGAKDTKIVDMHILDQGTKAAGMFASFKGDEIKGVTLIDQKIDGGTNVGGLCGIVNSTNLVKITECSSYLVEQEGSRKYVFKGDKTYKDNIYIKGKGNVGGLLGRAVSQTEITKSLAATVIKGSGNLGGIVGGTTAKSQISTSYGNSYILADSASSAVGGLAGSLNGASTISNCYTSGLGISQVAGISKAAGFVASPVSSILNSYSAFDISGANAATGYSTAEACNSTSRTYYLTAGNVISGTQPYGFADIATGKTALGSAFSSDNNAKDSYPYNLDSYEPKLKTYPYPSILGLNHYGDWAQGKKHKLGKVGLFYWEKMTGGDEDGYQIYVASRKKNDSGVFVDVIEDTTNTRHGDSGSVKEYGYGYYVAKKESGVGTYNLTTAPTWETAKLSVPSNTNADAQASLAAKYGDYVFTCYTVCGETNPASAYNAGTAYMHMTANEQNAGFKIQAEGEPLLSYSFSPFFAKAISLQGASSTGISSTVGTAANPYRVRCADQLQFINWNSVNKNNLSDYEPQRKSSYFYNNYYPYLQGAKVNLGWYLATYNWWAKNFELASNHTGSQNQSFVQDHDINGKDYSFTPIAAFGITSKDNIIGLGDREYNTVLEYWFGGSYNGQSYKILDLPVESTCYAVGLFSATAGAKLENIVMSRSEGSTEPPVVKRPAAAKTGAYVIGSLVGVALDYGEAYNDYSGYIKNCAVAGYKVIDQSAGKVFPGEANIGGLVGLLKTRMEGCSAVVDINIETYARRGGTRGDYIRAGGIAGANFTRIINSYSGGSLAFASNLTEPTKSAGGIAGGSIGMRFVNFTELYSTNNQEYRNCYTYMNLPDTMVRSKIYVIAGPADREGQEGKGIIDNCYYSKAIAKPGYVVSPISWSPANVTPLTLAQMSNQEVIAEKGNLLFTNALNTKGISSANFAAVTEGYSFPWGYPNLLGRNYPFASIIKNMSGSAIMANAHYGRWPNSSLMIVLKHRDEYINNGNFSAGIGEDGLNQSQYSNLFSGYMQPINASNAYSKSKFDGWYLKKSDGTYEKVLDEKGKIATNTAVDSSGKYIIKDGKFVDNGGQSVELYAMWYKEAIIFVNNNKYKADGSNLIHDNEQTGIKREFILIARNPRTDGDDSTASWYAIIGDSGRNAVSAVGITVQKDLAGNYKLADKVTDDMRWQVVTGNEYFETVTSNLRLGIDRNNTAILVRTGGLIESKYDHNAGRHNLYFGERFYRLLLNDQADGLYFDISGDRTFGNTDGGMYLFEYKAEGELHD